MTAVTNCSVDQPHSARGRGRVHLLYHKWYVKWFFNTLRHSRSARQMPRSRTKRNLKWVTKSSLCGVDGSWPHRWVIYDWFLVKSSSLPILILLFPFPFPFPLPRRDVRCHENDLLRLATALRSIFTLPDFSQPGATPLFRSRTATPQHRNIAPQHRITAETN